MEDCVNGTLTKQMLLVSVKLVKLKEAYGLCCVIDRNAFFSPKCTFSVRCVSAGDLWNAVTSGTGRSHGQCDCRPG